MEYCQQGSLYDILKKARSDLTVARRLTWDMRLRMVKNAANGMLHLHTRSPPIIHRDLKSPNLLLTSEWVVKVADMGLGTLAEEANVGITTSGSIRNPRWMAPEVINGESATTSSDVYSFGVIMWELLTWEAPFAECFSAVWVSN